MFGRKQFDLTQATQDRVLYDKPLLFSALAILAIGLLMVASASIVVSQKQYDYAFYYFIRQSLYVVIGFILCGFMCFTKIEKLRRASFPLLCIVGCLLLFVLIPGIGRQINGSARWIGLGPIGIQVSEIAKFAMVAYLADYLVRRQIEVRETLKGFIKPLGLMGIYAVLLLTEPDFGATVVIVATGLAMMFLGGVKTRHFAVLLVLVIVLFALIAMMSPYRLERLSTFLNPWAHAYDSGYQLTQSLIAFGRGGWFGVGLGDSIQKLFYLPEAHTDFLFAILTEELGLFGALVVIALYSTVVFRALKIAKRALEANLSYAGLLAFGFGIWLAIQFIVNVGVNMGLLPTKGLTLPLMSYGGSSLVVDMIAISFLLRVDYETNLLRTVE